MARQPRRQLLHAPYYHVMNRAHNREMVFQHPEDFAHFLNLLSERRQRYAVRVYHYCLMSNHFHLLLDCAVPRDLSACMAGLLRAHVHYYNRRHGFVGHLWQGRFKSPAVAVADYFLSCARYIERNPVAAGMVVEPWTYPWSSARANALGVDDGLLSYNVWYRDLSAEAGARQQRWREFLLRDDPHEEEVRWGDWIEGDDGYRRRMQQEEARPGRRRGRPRQPPPGQEEYFPQFHEDTVDP